MRPENLAVVEQKARAVYRKREPGVRAELLEAIADTAAHGRDTGDYDPLNRMLNLLSVHETITGA